MLRSKLALGAFGVVAALLATPAYASIVQLQTLELVMAGASSSGANQVWARVAGQPAGVPVECVYNGNSLFFVDGSSGVDPNKFLSIFLTAKASSRPVIVYFDIDTNPSDFFGFGISKCRMARIAMQ